MRASETPIFATMISELGQQRAEALGRVAELRGLLADLEALHERDGDGDCPACMAPAPCVTMLLLRGDIDSEQAFGALAGAQVIDLARAESATAPVPSLTELLTQPTRGMDRFFDALLGLSVPGDNGAARAS